jgi:hypothetical protein
MKHFREKRDTIRFFDELLPDTSARWPIGGYEWQYLGRAGDDTFVVSHWGQTLTGVRVWVANVTKTTGCPLRIY